METPAGLEKDTTSHTISILSNAFANDAFQRYLLLDDLQSSRTHDIDPSLHEQTFKEVVPKMVEDGATLITVPGSSIASVWVLEEHEDTYEPESGTPEAIVELNTLAHTVHKRVLAAPQSILHLVLVANDRSQPASAPANVSHLIRPVLAMAKEKGWPVVLEATSPRSRDVYAYLGFEVLEEMRVGKGKVDAEGWGCADGEGVLIWAMMFGAEKK